MTCCPICTHLYVSKITEQEDVKLHCPRCGTIISQYWAGVVDDLRRRNESMKQELQELLTEDTRQYEILCEAFRKIARKENSC